MKARYLKMILATSLIALLVGCAERDEQLPNGYRFVELNRGNGAIITNDGGFAVYPNIVMHQVRGNLVVGKRVLTRENADGSASFTTGLGYFVFNTSTGHLSLGLAKPPQTNGS